MILFFDTSALVKLFHEEEGTKKVTELVGSTQNSNIWFSELSKLEFASTLHRKFRENKLDDVSLKSALADFQEFLGCTREESLSSEVLNEANNLIDQYGKLLGLRTLDSIILATYSLLNEQERRLVAADTTLVNIARKMSFRVINPLE